MRIEYLREFLRLAGNLSYRQTADELFITQPALSRHIISLERELGTSLFVRNSKSVRLTEEGRFFRDAMRDVVERYDDAVDSLRGMSPTGSLGIGMLYYSKEHMMPAISSFSDKYPTVNLHFLSKTPNEVVEALHADEIDVGSILDVPFASRGMFVTRFISEEPMVLLTDRRHRLASRRSVSMKELAGERIVNVDDAFYRGYYAHVTSELGRYGVTVGQEPYLVGDVEEMLLAVQNGRGIALLSQNLRKQKVPLGVFHDLKEDVTIKRCLAYKPRNSNPALKLFLDEFD